MKILILFAHPAFQRSRANQRLVSSIQNLENVHLQDLYEIYPNFQIDIQAEQQLLRDHDLIVFHHPFYWYSSPALLKEWQDLVLEHGFAYGHGGTALHGKHLLSAITTGGSADAYRREGINHFTIAELLRPFEQTARLCGMSYLPPFVAHGVLQENDESLLQNAANAYRAAITGLRDGTLDPKNLDHFTYLNEAVQPEGDAHA